MSQRDGITTSDETAQAISSAEQPGHTLENSANAINTDVAVSSPDFPSLGERKGTRAGIPLDRFYDVTVRVWAELGQVTLPISEMLQLGEGAVMKLSRPVSDPIDLMAQGVRFAKGEVVVVDNCFAVRITEIDSDCVPSG